MSVSLVGSIFLKPQVNFTWHLNYFFFLKHYFLKQMCKLFLTRCHLLLLDYTSAADRRHNNILQLYKRALQASMMITVVNISMEVTTKHQQQMEDSHTFYQQQTECKQTFKWMAVECCNGFGPFSQNKSCHLQCISLTQSKLLYCSTHKNIKQHRWINSYNYLQLQLFCSSHFLLYCTQTA